MFADHWLRFAVSVEFHRFLLNWRTWVASLWIRSNSKHSCIVREHLPTIHRPANAVLVSLEFSANQYI